MPAWISAGTLIAEAFPQQPPADGSPSGTGGFPEEIDAVFRKSGGENASVSFSRSIITIICAAETVHGRLPHPPYNHAEETALYIPGVFLYTEYIADNPGRPGSARRF